MAWPTTDDPRTEFVTLRLTKDEARDLDWYIGVRSCGSRSAAVRDALDRAVHAEKRKASREKAGADS